MREKIKKYNLSVVLIPLMTLIIVCSLIFIYPTTSADIIDYASNYLTGNLSWYYLGLGFITLVILAWLAFGKLGNVKLGHMEKPLYSDFEWIALIFTSTMTADMLYYTFSEWMNSYNVAVATGNNPVDFALMYPMHHLGITPWAFFILPAIAYGYWIHNKNKSIVNISDALNIKSRFIKKIVNFLVIFTMLISVFATFVISSELLTMVVSDLFNVAASAVVSIAIFLITGIIYILCIFKNGLGKLAKINVWCYVFLFAVFLFNPQFNSIVGNTLSGLGKLMQNFIVLNTDCDIERSLGGYVQNTTVFFWAYWIAWATMTPVFIGKISGGRTIRSVILGGILFGAGGELFATGIFGNFGLVSQLDGSFDAIGLLQTGMPVGSVIIELIKNRFGTAFSTVILIVSTFAMLFANATSLDAMVVVTAEASYKSIDGKPSKRMLSFWCMVFLMLPIAFILNIDKLYSVQTILILSGLPMSVVLIRVVYVFLKDLTKKLI